MLVKRAPGKIQQKKKADTNIVAKKSKEILYFLSQLRLRNFDESWVL